MIQDSVSIESAMVFWLVWARIAVKQEAVARGVRRHLLEVAADGAYIGPNLEDELEASLQSIGATAHALDGFYGSVSDLIVTTQMRARWRQNRTSRSAIITESLKQGFDVGNRAQLWGRDVRWLFGLRDPVVHARHTFQAVALHPAGTNVDPNYVVYSVESAERAVELLMQVLDSCLGSPKPEIPGLTERLKLWAGSFPELTTLRKRLESGFP